MLEMSVFTVITKHTVPSGEIHAANSLHGWVHYIFRRGAMGDRRSTRWSWYCFCMFKPAWRSETAAGGCHLEFAHIRRSSGGVGSCPWGCLVMCWWSDLMICSFSQALVDLIAKFSINATTVLACVDSSDTAFASMLVSLTTSTVTAFWKPKLFCMGGKCSIINWHRTKRNLSSWWRGNFHDGVVWRFVITIFIEWMLQLLLYFTHIPWIFVIKVVLRIFGETIRWVNCKLISTQIWLKHSIILGCQWRLRVHSAPMRVRWLVMLHLWPL